VVQIVIYVNEKRLRRLEPAGNFHCLFHIEMARMRTVTQRSENQQIEFVKVSFRTRRNFTAIGGIHEGAALCVLESKGGDGDTSMPDIKWRDSQRSDIE